jgi:hypothetical protein
MAELIVDKTHVKPVDWLDGQFGNCIQLGGVVYSSGALTKRAAGEGV